ncbi:hypothetical protein QTP86_018148, partial [Hemibagrus guttatus]
PNVVNNLTVSNKTLSSVYLTWNKPHRSSSFFTVIWTGGSVNNSSNTSDTSYTVTGLTAGVNYTFTVTAVAEDNQTTGAPTQTSAFTSPNIVNSLNVSGITTSSVSLTWNEPNGSRSFFRICWNYGSGNNSSDTSSNLSYTVTGLTAGVNYTFTVTAVAADKNTAGESTEISAFTKPNSVTSLNISSKNSSSVSLTWNKPNGSSSFFTVNWTGGSVNMSGDTSNNSYTVTGLTAGVNYTFTVTAIAADGQTAGASAHILAFTNPEVVKNLSVSIKTSSSVSLTWNEPHGNSSFFTVNWTDGSVNNSSNTSDLSYTVTGLTAGVNYTFTVTAVAADNQTTGAPTQTSTFTMPGVSSNLTAFNRTTSTVSLTWNEPHGNRSFFILNWTGDSVNKSSDTSNTSYTVTGLTAGVNYTFSVTAVAADGQTRGELIQISAFTKPDVPRDLKVTEITTSSVFLNWTQPIGERYFFNVQWSNDTITLNSTTTNTFFNITDLNPGVGYTILISAVAAEPDTVSNLTTVNVTTTSILLYWTEAVGNISHYVIQYENFNMTVNNTTEITRINIANLTPGVQYTFKVFAVAADNKTEGNYSCISTYTKPDTVSNLTTVNVTTTSILLYWNEAVGKISHYVIQYENFNMTVNNTTEITRINITNLTPGVQYTFKVFAVAADNKTEGNYSCISTYTKPDVPRDLKVTEITTSSVFLNWTKPIGKMYFFKVQWSNDTITLNSTTTNTFCNITDLNPGVSYTILISAVAADNITEGEAISLSVYTKPGTVSSLTTVNVTTTSILLYWIEAGGKISHYVIQYENFNMTVNETTEITRINITNLTPGVQYTFKVFAVAADNKTEGNYSCISAYTKPDTVRNLTTVNVTTTSILLYWIEAVGKISHYVIQYENFNMTVNKTTEITRINITNLTPGVQYTFKVFAVAADNKTEGNYSCISAYAKPDTVSNLTTVNVTTTSILLYWTEAVGKISHYVIQYENFNMTVNNTTEITRINIANLTPGVQYTFKVFAVAADNKTEGNYSCISAYTKPDAVRNLTSSDVTTSSMVLRWDEPSGKWSFFRVQWMNNNITSYIANINITDLKPGTNYTFAVSAVAADNKTEGSMVKVSTCTEPPVPSMTENVTIEVTPISQNIINLQFSASLLNGSNGPIEAYGVLLSTDPQSNISNSVLTMTYSDWKNGTTKAYLTVLKLNENENKNRKSNMITIVIGNYSDVLINTAYQNGPLGNQEYRVALVLFTYLEINDRLVDIQQSIYSITPFAKNIAKPLEPQSYTIAIVLGVLLPIIVLLIIAIIVLVIQKRRITKDYTDIPVNNLRTKISIPVRLEEFEAYFKKQQLDSNCGFAEQYEDLKVVGTAQTKNSALAMENKGKNRYNNVLPYDSSRVKLSIHGSPFDDYINANNISGYNSKKEYIAAQGPLPATVNEFWRMIWEKHCHTIVMLTKCYEQGRVKCEKYWPPESKLYSNILVTTTSEIELEDWTIREFTIKNVKTAETRNVRQFHFTAWPDHGVPETTEVLINFRHLVREHMDSFSRNAPAVVHCSAGVGRTGTFIALDHLIFQIERDSMVDIYGIIYDMRMHRPLMVQTEDQYVFLNQCASDIIKSRMGTNVDLIYQNAAAFSIYENVQR